MRKPEDAPKHIAIEKKNLEPEWFADKGFRASKGGSVG